MSELDDIMHIALDAAIDDIRCTNNDIEKIYEVCLIVNNGLTFEKIEAMFRNLHLLPNSIGTYFYDDLRMFMDKRSLEIKRMRYIGDVSVMLRLLASEDNDMASFYDSTGGNVIYSWLLKFMFCDYSVMKIDNRTIYNSRAIKTLMGLYKRMVVADKPFVERDVLCELMKYNLGAYLAVNALNTYSNKTVCYHLSCRCGIGKVPYSNFWTICYNPDDRNILMTKTVRLDCGDYFEWTDCYIATSTETIKRELCAVLVNRYDRKRRNLCVIFKTMNDPIGVRNLFDALLTAGVEITQDELCKILN